MTSTLERLPPAVQSTSPAAPPAAAPAEAAWGRRLGGIFRGAGSNSGSGSGVAGRGATSGHSRSVSEAGDHAADDLAKRRQAAAAADILVKTLAPVAAAEQQLQDDVAAAAAAAGGDGATAGAAVPATLTPPPPPQPVPLPGTGVEDAAAPATGAATTATATTATTATATAVTMEFDDRLYPHRTLLRSTSRHVLSPLVNSALSRWTSLRYFDAVEVLPRLFLGSCMSSRNLAQLRARSISHVLCVAKEVGAAFPQQAELTCMVLPLSDETDQLLLPYFALCNAFIEEGMRAGGVLVHCVAGASRSATIITQFCMSHLGLTPMQGIEMVGKVRAIYPHDTFYQQLEAWAAMGCRLDPASPAMLWASRKFPRRLEAAHVFRNGKRCDIEPPCALGRSAGAATTAAAAAAGAATPSNTSSGSGIGIADHGATVADAAAAVALASGAAVTTTTTTTTITESVAPTASASPPASPLPSLASQSPSPSPTPTPMLPSAPSSAPGSLIIHTQQQRRTRSVSPNTAAAGNPPQPTVCVRVAPSSECS